MKRILKLSSLFLALVFTSCVCSKYNLDGGDARDAMSSSVKIEVTLNGAMLSQQGSEVVAEEREISWSGSGVVVALDRSRGNGESLVMSAAHVTNVKPKSIMSLGGETIYFIYSFKMSVITLDGRTCEAEPVYVDADHDLGVIRVLCVAGEVAQLADELPPVGSQVLTSGAALGFHTPGTFIVTDGRYVGKTESEVGSDPELVLTLPGAPGHSGSGIFYNGKVFSILTKGSDRFHHIIVGTDLEYLKKALKESLETWKGV